MYLLLISSSFFCVICQMGHKPGMGLGKNSQGIITPVEAVKRKGRGAIAYHGTERSQRSLKDFPVKDEEQEEEKAFQKQLSQWKRQPVEVSSFIDLIHFHYFVVLRAFKTAFIINSHGFLYMNNAHGTFEQLSMHSFYPTKLRIRKAEKSVSKYTHNGIEPGLLDGWVIRSNAS